MNNLFILLFLTTPFYCQNSDSQNTFKTIKEETGTIIFKGMIACSDLTKEESFKWYKTNYDSYKVDSLSLPATKLFKDVNVVLFLGTWCGDSKREVPKFFKILEKCTIPESRVTIYALDRTKKTEDSTFNKKYNIDRVPTYIFLKEGKEIGRIVESPKESLEKDISAILSNKITE